MSDDTLTIQPRDETAQIEAWRILRFLEMGADVEIATTLAVSRVDLHEFERLRQRGCGPLHAALILA